MENGQDKSILIRMTIADADDGTVFFTNEDPNTEAVSIIPGEGQIFPKVDAVLGSMSLGEKQSFVLSSEEAFGDWQNEYVQQFPLDKVPEELREVGQVLSVQMTEGQEIPGKITVIEDELVIVDFNHPMAGKNVRVDIIVTDK